MILSSDETTPIQNNEVDLHLQTWKHGQDVKLTKKVVGRYVWYDSIVVYKLQQMELLVILCPF